MKAFRETAIRDVRLLVVQQGRSTPRKRRGLRRARFASLPVIASRNNEGEGIAMAAAELFTGAVKPAFGSTGGYRRLVQRRRTAARRSTGPCYISEQAARRSSGRCA
jgi:hypothetical protein